ncbi:MAG: YggS family pyridoxal phosphate-dependent enzyme [Bacteriovoracaceae bacterium]
MESRQLVLAQTLKMVQAGLKSPTSLVAVSKTYPSADILAFYGLGVRDFGENQVQELEQKSQDLALLCPNIQWHMIGNLQTNKIRKLYSIKNLKAIHSVDRLSLVEALIKDEHLLLHDVSIFLQVKTSDEVEKSGFESNEELVQAISLLQTSSKLKIHGLMTMGKIRTEDQLGDAKICFQKLIEVRNELQKAFLGLSLKLSMGMSGDYTLASLMGSDYVRVGSLLFGPRHHT